MGKKHHPNAKRLMITADGGGSNGYRVRLWKVELQKLSDELKLPIGGSAHPVQAQLQKIITPIAAMEVGVRPIQQFIDFRPPGNRARS
jgi:hypothetical protein